MPFLLQARSRTRSAKRQEFMMGASGVKDETKAAASGSAAAPFEVEDCLIDDVEAAIMGNFPIFLEVGSTTEPESAEDTAL